MSKRDLKQRLDELFTSPAEPGPSPAADAPPATQVEPEIPLQGVAELTRANAALQAEIAELKRARAELQASERKFRDLVESANDLIQSVAPDGSILYVNRAWRET